MRNTSAAVSVYKQHSHQECNAWRLNPTQHIHHKVRRLHERNVRMQVKLTMRSVPMPGGAPSVPKPFLTFTCRGPNLNMVQDLPISKPHMPARAAAPPAHAC